MCPWVEGVEGDQASSHSVLLLTRLTPCDFYRPPMYDMFAVGASLRAVKRGRGIWAWIWKPGSGVGARVGIDTCISRHQIEERGQCRRGRADPTDA